LQTRRKGRSAHVTEGEQAGAANQDEEDGGGAYPQGDEHKGRGRCSKSSIDGGRAKRNGASQQ